MSWYCQVEMLHAAILVCFYMHFHDDLYVKKALPFWSTKVCSTTNA